MLTKPLNPQGREALSTMMRIAIDAHSIGTGLGGNETYAASLVEALAEIDQRNSYTIYVSKRDAFDRYANRWSNFDLRMTPPHTHSYASP
jgi:hypothetical protein